MPIQWARLIDWQTGPTTAHNPQSDVVQWILDAEWFNWSYPHRINISRDVEASSVIWLTPTRLGVFLGYHYIHNGDKSFAKIFVKLYDSRVIKLDLFQLRTYKEWFAEFCSNIEDEGRDETFIKMITCISAVTSFVEYTDDELD